MKNTNLLELLNDAFLNVSAGESITLNSLVEEFEVELPSYKKIIKIRIWKNQKGEYSASVNNHPDAGNLFKGIKEYTKSNNPEETIKKLVELYKDFNGKNISVYSDF